MGPQLLLHALPQLWLQLPSQPVQIIRKRKIDACTYQLVTWSCQLSVGTYELDAWICQVRFSDSSDECRDLPG